MNRKLVIFGNSNYAQMVAAFWKEKTFYDVVAHAIDSDYIYGNELVDTKAFDCKTFPPEEYDLFMALGYKKMRMRHNFFIRFMELGYHMPNLISEKAILHDNITFGSNNIVFPGAIVERNTIFGHNNTLWSHVTICHDSTIGSHNFFAAGATIGGGVTVGDLSFFGFNSCVKQYKKLGNETLLGALSFLNKNTGNHEQWLGSPAVCRADHSAVGIVISE